MAKVNEYKGILKSFTKFPVPELQYVTRLATVMWQALKFPCTAPAALSAFSSERLSPGMNPFCPVAIAYVNISK